MSESVKRWERAAEGIYRDTRSGMLYERPTVNGKRTFRSLGLTSVTDALAVLGARRTDQTRAVHGLSVDPYKATPAGSVGEILNRYAKDGYPDKQMLPRAGNTLAMERGNVERLSPFWSAIAVAEVRPVLIDRYFAWRAGRFRAGCSNRRSADVEINTLYNAFRWAHRCELIHANPLPLERPRYNVAKLVHHCREFCPANAEVLHSFATELFMTPGGVSEAMAFQMLVEAFTGLRTVEALALRTDAKEGQPGFISQDGSVLHVGRAKGQVNINPFVIIHPALKDCLRALFDWKAKKHPASPWFFPSPREGGKEPIAIKSLAHALRKASATLGVKVTSHGMRAFYVKVRRSHGVHDQQIAAEIGHESGGETLKSVYGSVPENWLTDGPKMEWTPLKAIPAWKWCGEAPKQKGSAGRKLKQALPSTVARVQPVGLLGRRKGAPRRRTRRNALPGPIEGQVAEACSVT